MSAFSDFTDKLFAPAPAPPPPPIFDQIALKTAEIMGYVSIVLIIVGSIVTLISVAIAFFKNKGVGHEELDSIRLKMGYYLLIALGFLISKDVILTLFEPSFKDIFSLVQLVVIGFVLRLFFYKD